MNYELALQLKEAGFPQKGKGHFETTKLDEPYYIPTLSELIEACEDDNFHLLSGSIVGAYIEWQAYTGFARMPKHIGVGTSPEEAVAKLWLALNKKDESN